MNQKKTLKTKYMVKQQKTIRQIIMHSYNGYSAVFYIVLKNIHKEGKYKMIIQNEKKHSILDDLHFEENLYIQILGGHTQIY